MALIERPDEFFYGDWPPLPPETLIKRAVSFSAGEVEFDPPVGPDRIQWAFDDDFTTVLIETIDG